MPKEIDKILKEFREKFFVVSDGSVFDERRKELETFLHQKLREAKEQAIEECIEVAEQLKRPQDGNSGSNASLEVLQQKLKDLIK